MNREAEELFAAVRRFLEVYLPLQRPMDGVVSSVEFGEDSSTNTAAAVPSGSAAAYAAYYGGASTAAAAASTSTTPVDGTAVLTLYPDLAMSITISIDETDILALKEGQDAEVEVSSVGEDLFPGTVTAISKVADTSTGVTLYSAEVTLDKAPGMLSGMTASVDVKIEGVENAMIVPVEHNVFHVSNLKKCLANETLEVPL